VGDGIGRFIQPGDECFVSYGPVSVAAEPAADPVFAGGDQWWAILLLIFAPNLSALAQLALSRTREYDADLNGVRLTGDPEGLARALAKIDRMQGGGLEQIFLPGRRVPEPSIWRTHPQTEERIARLMALKPQLPGGMGYGLSMSMRKADLGSVLGRPISRPPGWHINGLWHEEK